MNHIPIENSIGPTERVLNMGYKVNVNFIWLPREFIFMNVLGVHCGHNASACFVADGELQWAVQEERLTNEKNRGGFPGHSIDLLLDRIDGTVDAVAVASRNSPSGSSRENRIENYRQRSSLTFKTKDRLRRTPLYRYHLSNRQTKRMDQLGSFGFGEDQISFVEHHRCHAAAAYYGSEWRDDVVVLTNDGRGDKLCATVNIGRGGELERIHTIPEGNSVGNLYALTTLALGFIPLEHEYKLMGMAPYVKDEEWRKRVKDIYYDYLELDGMDIERKIRERTYTALPKIKEDLDFLRFDWVSAGLQAFTEEILSGWVENCMTETGCRRVCLAGGTFMNVKTNKIISELNVLDDIFVFPSCGDESNSIGAAFAVAAGSGDEIEPLSDVYLGPAIDESDVRSELSDSEYQWERYDDIEAKVAELLASGNVVARCKDRMEFGARALGNRSILADPQDQDVVRIINDMIKERDFWMPFAPSILAERADDYVHNPKGLDAPYMINAFDTTENWKEMIAAVQPADKTSRPQIVTEADNPDYHHLIEEFEDRTGRGVVLNTSFNLHGYPIVYGPEEALWVFGNSGLEYLALGSYLVST